MLCVSQCLNSVQVVNEGEVVEMSKDFVRHVLSDVDLMSAFTATAKWQSMMPLELWDQTLF